MKRFALAILVLLIGITSYADVAPPKTLKMKVGLGLGWALCPSRGGGLPPLAEAYLCSGLKSVPRTVEVEMEWQKAAKPEWLFYQGAYNTSTTFQDVTVTMEALVMYAKIDGTTTAFVDGRLVSTQAGAQAQPIYFRASADGGSQNFTYSSTYGTMSPIKLSNGKFAEFSPYVTIAKPE